jgi:hypothetical protein
MLFGSNPFTRKRIITVGKIPSSFCSKVASPLIFESDAPKITALARIFCCSSFHYVLSLSLNQAGCAAKNPIVSNANNIF